MIRTPVFKNSLLALSAVLMSGACAISFSGLNVFLKKESSVSYEGLHVIAYMALYSSVLWVPFFIFYIWPKAQVNPLNKAVSSIPFFVMACFICYLFFCSG